MRRKSSFGAGCAAGVAAALDAPQNFMQRTQRCSFPTRRCARRIC
jgi:hypothetical protein